MFGTVTGVLGIRLTSALLGGLGGVVTYGALNWNERRIRRDRFRRSIVFEIGHIREALDRLDRNLHEPIDGRSCADLDQLRSTLSTDILDADFQAIGKLTTREIRAVYRFHEACRVVSRKINADELDGVDPSLQASITEAIETGDTALDRINRSRLSRATEWYKDVEADR